MITFVVKLNEFIVIFGGVAGVFIVKSRLACSVSEEGGLSGSIRRRYSWGMAIGRVGL